MADLLPAILGIFRPFLIRQHMLQLLDTVAQVLRLVLAKDVFQMCHVLQKQALLCHLLQIKLAQCSCGSPFFNAPIVPAHASVPLTVSVPSFFAEIFCFIYTILLSNKEVLFRNRKKIVRNGRKKRGNFSFSLFPCSLFLIFHVRVCPSCVQS